MEKDKQDLAETEGESVAGDVVLDIDSQSSKSRASSVQRRKVGDTEELEMGDMSINRTVQRDLSINNFNSTGPLVKTSNENVTSKEELTDFRRMQLQKEAAEQRKLNIKRRKRRERLREQ